MLTAGPTGSVGSALRSPTTNCARVSLTVPEDKVSVLLSAAELVLAVELVIHLGENVRAVTGFGYSPVVTGDPGYATAASLALMITALAAEIVVKPV
jgi:hypothetical protein